MVSTKNGSLSSNNTVLVVRYTSSASEPPPSRKVFFIFIYEIEYGEEDLKASPSDAKCDRTRSRRRWDRTQDTGTPGRGLGAGLGAGPRRGRGGA